MTQIDTVRELHRHKYSMRSIAAKLKWNFRTVSKYLKQDAVRNVHTKKRYSILTPHIYEACRLADTGYTGRHIHEILVQKGYTALLCFMLLKSGGLAKSVFSC